MSDFDPVAVDIRNSEMVVARVVISEKVPQIVANELRRLYMDTGDPALWFLILRAQEIEIL